MSGYKQAFVFLLGLLLLAAGLNNSALQNSLGLDSSLAQAVAFPAVLLFLACLKFFNRKIPRWLLALAAVCAAAAVGFSCLHVVNNRKVLVVARLQDDEYETETRIFREQINRALRRDRQKSKIRAVRYWTSFRNIKDVMVFLKENAEVPAVIWGNTRWINVAFSPLEEQGFPTAELKHWLEAAGLKVVTMSPSFGLSYRPRELTAEFLGRLFAGKLFAGGGERELFGGNELDLREAAGMSGPWTAPAHRAYAYWFLGNVLMASAFDYAAYDAGELGCAIRAYDRARFFLQPRDNPELLSAIYNNRAVARYLQGMLQGKKKSKKTAILEFKLAAQLLRQPDPFKIGPRAGKIAKKNLAKLKNKSKRKPKHKEKGGGRYGAGL